MDKGNLASQLHEWSYKEMHFRPKGKYVDCKPPVLEDFQELCRGPTADALKYVVDHIYSSQTVYKVKGNIKLRERQLSRGPGHSHAPSKQVGENTEHALLMEKHKDLSYQLTNNLTAIGHVEKDITRIRKELLNTERHYREAQNHMQDLQRKSALLKSHSLGVHDTDDTLAEYKKRITDKTEFLLNRAQRNEGNAVLTEAGRESSNSEFETVCTKIVRETCHSISSFLQEMLQGKFGDNTELMSKKKELLWRKVESLVSQHPPRQVLLSLNMLAHQCTTALRERTAMVNIHQDAEELRFKYEKGNLKDISNPPTVLQTVGQLLQQAHTANFERFVQTEKSKNRAWKLEQRLSQAKEPVLAHLERSYRGDPGTLQLAKNLLDAEIQIAASRANRRELETASEFLKDSISTGMAKKEMLFSKYQKIQSFQKLAESKQNLIQVLIKQNLNAKDRLQSQQQQIQKYIDRAMGVHDPETKSHCAELENCVAAEVESFANVTLPYLMFTVLDSAWKVAVLDLSVNRFRGGHNNSAAVHTLWTIMEMVDSPAFKAPECLLRNIVALKRQHEELETLQGLNLYDTDSEYRSLAENLAVLSKAVDKSDAEQMEKLLPRLQKHLAQSTQALTQCLDVKDSAHLWWEQPAQYCLPWIKVDQLSFRQWHDKWRVLITQLRQVLVKKGKQVENM